MSMRVSGVASANPVVRSVPKESPSKRPPSEDAIDAYLHGDGSLPFTQEDMIESILGRGDGGGHPSADRFPDVLHASIERMVGQICGKYVSTTQELEEDLVQDCMFRIWKKLDQYDPKKAKFTTWAYRVCRSVLNRKYRLVQRRRNRVTVVEDPTVVGSQLDEEVRDDVQLGSDFCEAIRELISCYPGRRKLILAMFGNPDDDGYEPPRDVFVVKASRAAGVARSDAFSFYENRVMPFLRERFR